MLVWGSLVLLKVNDVVNCVNEADKHGATEVVEKEGGESEEDVAVEGVVGNVDVDEGDGVKENVAKRGYEGEAESFNEEGLVDVNINRDGHSDSDWDGNVPSVVERASDGEGWYTTQESSDSDSDEVRTEGG